MARFFTLLLLLLLATSYPLSAQSEQITSIAAIRSLTPEAAGLVGPVILEGLTTFYDPEVGSFFVVDATGSIYINMRPAARPQHPLRPSDLVRIHGTVSRGNFQPQVELMRLEWLGTAPLPVPRRITPSELMDPALDCEWVELNTVLKGTVLDRFGALFFELTADGVPLMATVSRGEKFTSPPWDLLQRPVRMRCVVSSLFNDERQLCGRRLFIASLHNIVPETPPPDRSAAPLLRTDQMLLVTSPAGEMVRLRGTVTRRDPGAGLTLRDTAGSALVRTAQPLELAAGDLVEVRGFPAAAPFRPVLQAVEVRRLGKGGDASPVSFTPKAPIPSRYHQALITMDVTLIDVIPGRDSTTLLCLAAGGERFEALTDAPLSEASLAENITPSARLRLTGICDLILPHPRSGQTKAFTFQLLLRGPGDLQVLQSAPWLTDRRAAWLLGGLCAAALLIALWVLVLRRRVRAQSTVIRQQAGREATMEERQRIARELHDTLEQDLMGVTLLLDSTAQHLQSAPPAATKPLMLARHLLRRSREESHSTIRDLRSVALDQLGLPGAMEELLQPIATAASLTFSLEVSGSIRRLPAVIELHLLRIAHEGISNAVKHAGAGKVTVHLDYALETVHLEIRDNGQGGASATGTNTGFGLQSIRERANKLGAALHLDSPEGGGTRICLTVPLPPIPASIP